MRCAIPERVYEIRRTPQGVTCTVNGEPLNPRLDLWNHSPTGFEFGYGGSGPAQLALALLADCCGDEVALNYHQQFKWLALVRMPPQGCVMTGTQIRDVVKVLRQQRLTANYRNN